MKTKLVDWAISAGALFARLTLAVVFIPAGWGKLQNLEKPIGFFEQLGIPFPSIMAPTVAGFELVCGALLLVGLLTRLAALPVIGIMIVAILTAKMQEISAITDVTTLSEFLYIVLAAMLVGLGSGKLGVDYLLKKEDTPTVVHHHALPLRKSMA